MMQIWHQYTSWECFHAGMYNYGVGPPMEEGKERYRMFLSNLTLFEEQAHRLITEWPISCEHFLTKDAMNRIAWVGQASMCIHSGLSRKYRSGFHLLTSTQKNAANHVAALAINTWHEKHKKARSRVPESLEGKGLFG